MSKWQSHSEEWIHFLVVANDFIKLSYSSMYALYEIIMWIYFTHNHSGNIIFKILQPQKQIDYKSLIKFNISYSWLKYNSENKS